MKTGARIGVLVALISCTACALPLPEADSEPAILYVRRCGSTCHKSYRPNLMTAKMWEAMVERMEIDMRRSGEPLAADEKVIILEYLQRNAGGR